VYGTLLGQTVLLADAREQVTKRPSREQVLAQGGDGIAAPVAGVVGVLNAAIANVLYVWRRSGGVTAAAPVMAMGAAMPGAAAGDGAAAAAPVEEKPACDVILNEAGPHTIPGIQVVRERTNRGLQEAKDLVAGAPKPVRTGVSRKRPRQPRRTWPKSVQSLR
jgi:ribosomal protein L7/L12